MNHSLPVLSSRIIRLPGCDAWIFDDLSCSVPVGRPEGSPMGQAGDEAGLVPAYALMSGELRFLPGVCGQLDLPGVGPVLVGGVPEGWVALVGRHYCLLNTARPRLAVAGFAHMSFVKEGVYGFRDVFVHPDDVLAVPASEAFDREGARFSVAAAMLPLALDFLRKGRLRLEHIAGVVTGENLAEIIAKRCVFTAPEGLLGDEWASLGFHSLSPNKSAKFSTHYTGSGKIAVAVNSAPVTGVPLPPLARDWAATGIEPRSADSLRYSLGRVWCPFAIVQDPARAATYLGNQAVALLPAGFLLGAAFEGASYGDSVREYLEMDAASLALVRIAHKSRHCVLGANGTLKVALEVIVGLAEGVPYCEFEARSVSEYPYGKNFSLLVTNGDVLPPEFVAERDFKAKHIIPDHAKRYYRMKADGKSPGQDCYLRLADVQNAPKRSQVYRKRKQQREAVITAMTAKFGPLPATFDWETHTEADVLAYLRFKEQVAAGAVSPRSACVAKIAQTLKDEGMGDEAAKIAACFSLENVPVPSLYPYDAHVRVPEWLNQPLDETPLTCLRAAMQPGGLKLLAAILKSPERRERLDLELLVEA